MRHRGRVRREARERAPGEPVHSPEQLLEFARVERTLADLVIALDDATVRRRLSEAVE